jgi:hypothetical protein
MKNLVVVEEYVPFSPVRLATSPQAYQPDSQKQQLSLAL